MNPIEVANIVAAAAQVLRSVGPLIPQAVDALSSDDAGKLKAALADIQKLGDETHAAVQAKLRGR